MKNTGSQAIVERNSRLGRILIFLFFVAGSLLAQWVIPEKTVLDGLFPLVFQYALVFGSVLILSASILGIALLPMCAFVFGGLIGHSAARLIGEVLAGAGLDMKSLLVSLVAVPIFFVVSVRGMISSEMLGSVLDKSHSSARAEYNQVYIPMTIAALAGILAVYLIIGSPQL